MAAQVHVRAALRAVELYTTYTLKAMLLNGYADNPDHKFVSDLVASEIATTGYARVTVTGAAAAEEDALNSARLNASSIAFGSIGVPSGAPATKLAIFRDVGGSDATREVISTHDCVISLNGGTFTATLTNGILTLTV